MGSLKRNAVFWPQAHLRHSVFCGTDHHAVGALQVLTEFRLISRHVFSQPGGILETGDDSIRPTAKSSKTHERHIALDSSTQSPSAQWGTVLLSVAARIYIHTWYLRIMIRCERTRFSNCCHYVEYGEAVYRGYNSYFIMLYA